MEKNIVNVLFDRELLRTHTWNHINDAQLYVNRMKAKFENNVVIKASPSHHRWSLLAINPLIYEIENYLNDPENITLPENCIKSTYKNEVFEVNVVENDVNGATTYLNVEIKLKAQSRCERAALNDAFFNAHGDINNSRNKRLQIVENSLPFFRFHRMFESFQRFQSLPFSSLDERQDNSLLGRRYVFNSKSDDKNDDENEFHRVIRYIQNSEIFLHSELLCNYQDSIEIKIEATIYHNKQKFIKLVQNTINKQIEIMNHYIKENWKIYWEQETKRIDTEMQQLLRKHRVKVIISQENLLHRNPNRFVKKF